MWWIFRSAVVRKLGYVLVALAASFLFGHSAHAQTCSLWIEGAVTTVYYGSPDQACNILMGSTTAASGQTVVGVTAVSTGSTTANCLATTIVTASGAAAQSNAVLGTSTLISGVSGSSCTAIVPPSCSASSGNKDILVALAGSAGGTPSGGFCSGGCEYMNGGLNVVYGTTNQLEGKAVPTGKTCGTAGTAPTGDTIANDGNCVVDGVTTVCVDSTNNRGTFSVVATATPDAIQPDTPATPDTCESYASGAVACNADSTITAPPAPSMAGALTTPATPTAVVTSGGHKENYYTAAVVTASKAPTTTVTGSGNPGAPAGQTAGSAAGSGGGSGGTGLTAGNGDCGASSVDCTGDGTLPSLTRADTIQSNVQSYLDAISAAPIVAAFSSISGAWPSATCPTVPFTITAFGGSHDFDAFAPVCTIWGGTVAPNLSLVFLALWAVAGIRVIMSA